MVEGMQIPGDLDAISPEWMTAALSEFYPDAEVSAVEQVLRDDGTNRRARLGLTYSRGSGPATVFVKASDPAHAELNARTGGVFNEPRLFRSGVDLPLDHPDVYLALIDEPKLDFILVMEDISARGADPRDSTRPLTIDQAANGVRALARLHGAYWGQRLREETALAWVDLFVAWTGMGGGIAKSIEKAGDTIPPEVRAMTGEQIVGDYWTRYIASLGDGPATLLHGDPHIGNTYVLPDDKVGFLDWQVLRRGNFSLDLGYFLQGAVEIEDRRACESDLIDEYQAALGLPSDERPTRDEIWLRYRASVAHGLAIWLATFSYGGWQREEVSLALVQRYAAAFVDLDSVAAIEELVP